MKTKFYFIKIHDGVMREMLKMKKIGYGDSKDLYEHIWTKFQTPSSIETTIKTINFPFYACFKDGDFKTRKLIIGTLSNSKNCKFFIFMECKFSNDVSGIVYTKHIGLYEKLKKLEEKSLWKIGEVREVELNYPNNLIIKK